MSSHGTFATALNCMDGRSVFSTIEFMKKKYNVDFVDTITEPGMDARILQMTGEERAWLKRKAEISVKHHGSRTVAVVGHADCAGNPVEKERHAEHIHASVEVTKKILEEIDPALSVLVIGLWAEESGENNEWSIEEVKL